MQMRLKVRYTGMLSKRSFNAAKKIAFEQIGIFWHETLRPKHFTTAGATEYAYVPRVGERGNPHPYGFKSSYTGRKLRKFGHTKPLVWSGESKMLTAMRDVRATSKGVRVVLKANKFNFKNPHSDIDMRDEMTRVSRQEAIRLTRLFDRFLGRYLGANQDRREVRVA